MEESGLGWWMTFSFTSCGVFFRCLPEEVMAPGGTMKTRQAGGDSVMLWAMFCWGTLGPGIHVDITLPRTTYLNIVGDQVHPFMVTLVWRTWQRVQGVGSAFKFPRCQSDGLSVGRAGQTSPTYRALTSKLTGYLVPVHIQKSNGIHALMSQSYFGSTRGAYTILGRCF